MQFSECRKRGGLPSDVGGVRIVFRQYWEAEERMNQRIDPLQLYPRLLHHVFILPMQEDTEFSLISGGQQFLLFYRHRGDNLSGHMWFWGGVDGSELFFYKVSPATAKGFREHKEEGFFRALTPQKVGLFRDALQARVQRLGELFFCPIELASDEIIKKVESLTGRHYRLESFKDEPLWWTPNYFTGKAMVMNGASRPWGVGWGKITGPYGATILEGMHVFQVIGLQSPRGSRATERVYIRPG